MFRNRKEHETMPVRKMSEADRKRIFGGGLVVSGLKRPLPMKQSPEPKKTAKASNEADLKKKGA
jgi:hypothetical protein